MRIHVSLLAFCVALAGCKSSVDSANIDTVVVSSSPTAAAVRLNGEAVGRTPTTIKLDRTKNYELQVGKGGYLTETSDLKPRLITTSEGIEFGFPAAVKVNLTKSPAEGEAGVPVADNPEFKKLSKKALGEDAAAKESLQSDIAATKEAAVKIQAALAAREAAAKARLAEISKSIADTKASKGKDESAKAKLAEAELALAQATADAEAARASAEKNLKSVEARRAALAGSETKVAQAKAVVVKAKAAAQTSDDRLGKLEQNYATEMKALKDSQANAAIAIKALSARADELNRLATQDSKGKQSEDARRPPTPRPTKPSPTPRPKPPRTPPPPLKRPPRRPSPRPTRKSKPCRPSSPKPTRPPRRPSPMPASTPKPSSPRPTRQPPPPAPRPKPPSIPNSAPATPSSRASAATRPSRKKTSRPPSRVSARNSVSEPDFAPPPKARPLGRAFLLEENPGAAP
jgi:hypothetical protein